jgi:hypothetical protein
MYCSNAEVFSCSFLYSLLDAVGLFSKTYPQAYLQFSKMVQFWAESVLMLQVPILARTES